MSDIKFVIPKGQTIPLVIKLNVDGNIVTYNRVVEGFEFIVWYVDTQKAVEIVEKIIEKIKAENDDPKHGVTWRTKLIQVVGYNDRYGYVRVKWNCYLRDSG